MLIIDKCLKKNIPSNSELYSYLQQQYIFKAGKVPGLFSIVEVNTHHNTHLVEWTFPSFYRSYMGRLIFRRALYIKMWELQKSRAVTSLPNLPTLLKNIRYLTSFTDRVVEACLVEASQHTVTPTWVPNVLCEWLILEFHCGHGPNMLSWANEHSDEITRMEPTEFGESTLTHFYYYRINLQI